MKRLLKLLFSLCLMISICACSSSSSSKDDTSNTSTDTTTDWRDSLEGHVKSITVNYNSEKIGIIVQVVDETTINFYFDQKEEEMYDTITLPFGKMNVDTVLDNVLYSDYDENGYDDFEFEMADSYNHNISAIYKCDGTFTLGSFYTKDGIPSSNIITTWFYNAELTKQQLKLDQYGNWKTTDYAGTIYDHGYIYSDSSGNILYNFEGKQCGNVVLNGTCLVVTLNGVTSYYYDFENSF